MTDFSSLIESAIGSGNVSTEDLRNLLYAMSDQFTLLNTATGNATLNPVNSAQASQAPPPPPGAIHVDGANGIYQITITNQKTAINGIVYHEVSYSPNKSFAQNVSILPVSAANSMTVPDPGNQLYFRLRSSYDQANWSNYIMAATTPVASGLQSSAASANNTPLNQSNYAFVDSIDAGAAANVRVYGASGPYTSFVSVKGTEEKVLPSATIVNVPHGTSRIVSYDGDQYRVSSTLPGVFPDDWIPIGNVSVVGSGSPTLPTLTPILQSGHLIGATFTPGAGLTSAPTLTVADSGGGSGAAITAIVSGGKMTGYQITAAGENYTSNTSITAAGGVFAGASGGGQTAGGNGGRLTNI